MFKKLFKHKKKSDKKMSDVNAKESSPSRTPSLPWPIAELRRTTRDSFSTGWINDLSPMLIKLCEWTLFFLLGYLGFGYAWVLLFATLHYVKYKEAHDGLTETVMARLSTLHTEPEVLGRSMSSFPSWVAFPDFDRPEFINDIIAKLWPNIGRYATTFVVEFIEPEIKHILDQMKLETMSGFSVKKVDVGTIPARLGGIKVYNRNVDKGEIVMDAEVIYNGDARVLISLQGVQAEVKQVNFKGMARITLKPLLNTFPFIGGLEVCFLNKPLLEYGLGGIGTFGEMPGANSIIKTIVEDQIRSRFVWPNRFHLYLPIESVKSFDDQSYLLTKPSGVLEINVVEARDLVKMDKSLTGSGNSDPYAVVSIGTRKVSFRDKYIAKSLNPQFNYVARFEIEDYHGQDVKVDLFDFDNSTTDDFLGTVVLKLNHLVLKESFDEWMTLQEIKKGELRMQSTWKKALAVDNQDEDDFESFILSIYVDSCKNLGGSNKLPYPKCVLKHTQGDSASTQTRNKTRSPSFEEGFMFSCKNLDTDSVTVEVVDTKSSDARLGHVKIPVSFLKTSPRREFYSMEWKLEDSEDGSISVSAKLFGVVP